MRAVIRTEEALGAGEKARVLLVPADAFSREERIGDFGHAFDRSFHGLKKTGQKHGAVLVRKRHRLLRRQGISRGRRIENHESAGSLRREPFANVSLGRFCLRGEFGRSKRPRAGHCLIETEFVADENQSRIDRRSHFADGFHHKFVQLGFVDRLGAAVDMISSLCEATGKVRYELAGVYPC